MTDIAAIQELPSEECWALLARNVVGRLAVDIAGRPDIFPINYIVDDGTIVFRTGPGTKLAGAVLSRHVAFEIDGYEPDEQMAWSVVVKGTAREIDSILERFRAEELPLFPWVTSDKPDFVCIDPTQVTGRRFRVPAEVIPNPALGWDARADLAATDGSAGGM